MRQPILILFPFVGDPRECRGDVAFPPSFGPPADTDNEDSYQPGEVAVAPLLTPPPCISYALVQATVGVGTVIIVYVILIAYKM